MIIKAKRKRNQLTYNSRNQQIHNSKIYNRNLINNRSLLNLYKNGDSIYYFRYNILAKSINHCELNYRQTPQMPSYPHPNSPCVPSTLHFLNLIGSSAGARSAQRQRAKGLKPGSNYQPAPLIGRHFSPLHRYFRIEGKQISIMSVEFNDIIYNIPPGYGIMLGTPTTYPLTHLFSIYRSDSGSRIRVMLHLSRNRTTNTNLSASNPGGTLITNLKKEGHLPTNINNSNLQLVLYSLVRRNRP